MKAMILAAGMGTRLRPITDSLPKALVPVNGIPLLEWCLRNLAQQGVSEFIVNVHYLADMVLDFLRSNHNFGLNIVVSDESRRLLDTGGAVKKVDWLFADGNAFLVYNVDIITSIDVQAMLAHHRASQAMATLAVSPRPSSRYLLFDEQNKLHGWRNTQTGETKLPWPSAQPLRELGFGGVQVLSCDVFERMKGFDDAFSIIDFYLAQATSQRIIGYNIAGEIWLDVGKPESLLQAASAVEQCKKKRGQI